MGCKILHFHINLELRLKLEIHLKRYGFVYKI
jgi:hypothetical protein